MSLRRAPLVRRTELRRTASSRVSATPRRIASRTKSTGPTAKQRHRVTDRAGGCCEICGRVLFTSSWLGEHSFHHRRPRGMGGTNRADTNGPANLLLLCGTGTTGCHGYLEAHRALARHAGWLVEQTADPTTVPVVIHRIGRRLLTADGDYGERA